MAPPVNGDLQNDSSTCDPTCLAAAVPAKSFFSSYLVAFLFWFNLNFYSNFEARWAATFQIVFVALILLWSIWQLLALPMYPRLEKPGLRLALRNAAIVLGRYPLAVLVVVVIVAALLLIAVLFPLFAFFGAGAFIAVLCNRLVGAVVERELGRGTGDE